MLSQHLNDAAKTAVISSFLMDNGAALWTGAHAHGVDAETVAVHRGRLITVKRTYDIRIDGTPLSLPVSVDRFGRVSCHALPYVSFESAVDLLRSLLDAVPIARGAHAHHEPGAPGVPDEPSKEKNPHHDHGHTDTR